jgi:hypothetical protein
MDKGLGAWENKSALYICNKYLLESLGDIFIQQSSNLDANFCTIFSAENSGECSAETFTLKNAGNKGIFRGKSFGKPFS